MKERFGRPKGLSKEDIEREAEKELARLSRNAPGPSMGEGFTGGGFTGGGFGGPAGGMATPLDEIASSARRGRPSAPEPNLGVLGSIGGGPGGYKGETGEFDRGLGGYGGPSARRGGAAGQGPAPGLPADFEDPEEESATITGLALRDLAARDGTNPEDLIIRQDPGMAEAMRDEAMRRFFDRQQTRQPTAAAAPIDPANTVLGRLAARRKAEEEGRELDQDPPQGGGLLNRARQRQEAAEAASRDPAGDRSASVGNLRDRRGGKGAYKVDVDDDDGPQGLRARVTARRRDEIDAGNRPSHVFAMPSADDIDDADEAAPELAAMASRLYQARAKTARRGSGPAAGSKKGVPTASRAARATKASKSRSKPTSPKRAVAKRAVAKRAVAKRAVAKRAVAKRAVAKRAVAKRAVAKRAVAKRAVAKRAVAKRAVAKRAVAKRAVAKRAVAKRAVAKRAVAKRAVAKKAAGRAAAPVKKNDVATKRAAKPAKAAAEKAIRRR